MPVHSTEIEVRFRDIDALGHVNNAVYASFLEQARSAYFRDVVNNPLNSIGMVIADLNDGTQLRQRFEVRRVFDVGLGEARGEVVVVFGIERRTVGEVVARFPPRDHRSTPPASQGPVIGSASLTHGRSSPAIAASAASETFSNRSTYHSWMSVSSTTRSTV